MNILYVLFENASGIALFRTFEFEEIGMFIPHVKKSVLDISKFRGVVNLVTFQAFKTIQDSLDYMKSMLNGKVPIDLKLLLQDNFPITLNPKLCNVLGVSDEKWASAINEELNIKCITSGVVPELMRGLRIHFPKLIRDYKDHHAIGKCQQGLGHYYSRAQMNFNINKFDTMIVETISMLDQLNRDVTTLTGRVRQWFSLHFPELSKLVANSENYAKCIHEIKNRKKMKEDIAEKLQSVLNDSETVSQILSAAQNSMGMDIAPEDEDNIQKFVLTIFAAIKRRNEMMEYLKTKMHLIAPNVSVLMGEMAGARLISQARSLPALARLPASTVQVLGAEKSLFRTMKKRSGKLKKANGFISKFIASKCALASRMDCFSDNPSSSFGEELKTILEQQIATLEKKNGVVDPESEKRREALAARKRALRKIRKERRLQKKRISGKGATSRPALTNGTHASPEAEEKRTSKRKSKIFSASEELGDEMTHMKKKRKSMRNIQ